MFKFFLAHTFTNSPNHSSWWWIAGHCRGVLAKKLRFSFLLPPPTLDITELKVMRSCDRDVSSSIDGCDDHCLESSKCWLPFDSGLLRFTTRISSVLQRTTKLTGEDMRFLHLTLKMGPTSCTDTLVNNYQYTPCNIPEEQRSQTWKIFVDVTLCSLLPSSSEQEEGMFPGERHNRFLQHSDVCTPDNIASYITERM
jgi:hypothetical protein